MSARAPRLSVPLRALAAALAVGAIGAGALFACSGSGSHIYVARPYDPGRDCLEDPTAVDAVEGADPGLNCALKCALSPKLADGAAGVAYISTMCPPYPPGFDTSGLVGACPAAIGAADRQDYCLADGGSTNPAMPDGSAGDSGVPIQDAAPVEEASVPVDSAAPGDASADATND